MDSDTYGTSMALSRPEGSRRIRLRRTRSQPRSGGGMTTVPDKLGIFAQHTRASESGTCWSAHGGSFYLEEMERHSLHLRKSSSHSLTEARESYERRVQRGDVSTTPDDLGPFARHTEASLRGSWTAPGSVYEGASEGPGRKSTSIALANAREEYERRQAQEGTNTVPDEMGAFAGFTVASLSRKESIAKVKEEATTEGSKNPMHRQLGNVIGSSI